MVLGLIQLILTQLRICEIKGRTDKPLPLICSEIIDVQKIVEFNPTAEKLAAKFWPGPLTLVLRSKVKYNIWITHGASTLAVRVTSHPIANKLAKMSGGIIVSTSANISGEAPAISAQEAEKALDKKVNLILEGGQSHGGLSSTVLNISSGKIYLERKGPITADQIYATLKT